MIKRRHRGGMDRPFTKNPFHCEMRGLGGFGGGRHGHPGRRGARLFDYGELRLLVLALIADAPAHGYELIKTIEDRFGGAYTPSPGVIYPTLSWLEDMGYASVEAEGGRKSYAITDAGRTFLAENRAPADALFERAAGEGNGRGGRSTEVMRAMQNLKTALRLRLAAGEIDEAAQKIAKLQIGKP